MIIVEGLGVGSHRGVTGQVKGQFGALNLEQMTAHGGLDEGLRELRLCPWSRGEGRQRCGRAARAACESDARNNQDCRLPQVDLPFDRLERPSSPSRARDHRLVWEFHELQPHRCPVVGIP